MVTGAVRAFGSPTGLFMFPVSLVDLLTFVLQMSCASWTLLNLLAEHGWFTRPKIAGAYSQASPVAGFGTATVQ